MTTRRCGGRFQAVLVGTLLCTSSGLPSVSHAQVTPSGLGTAVDQPVAGTYNITGGTRPSGGTNLFHSFGNFSVNTGESANFLNSPAAPATANILARVTAGNPSNIFGTINTLDFGTANLFLMNPAGIIFGPTARLDVGGSFHATTADYIKLGNDGIFYADPAQATVLTTSPPSAFGFLSANPKPIEVQTGGIDFSIFYPAAQLMVPQEQTLSLVGGNAPGSDIPGVSIGALDGSTPGYVVAPGGRVNLVSVASAGEATFDGVGFNVDGFSKLGSIKVGPGSIVDGKEIFIRGGNLAINDGVVLPGAFAFELSFVGFSPLPDGGQVNIKVTDAVTITGSARELLTFAPPGIFVYTGDPLGNYVAPAAKVPDVTINAGSVSISGFAGIQVQRNAPGEAGHVTINADKVSVGSGGSIVLINAIEGEGPSLTINARQVDVSGNGSDSPFAFEGLAAQGLRNPAYPFSSMEGQLITGNSGNITINASDSLAVSGLGQITTDSRNFGRAGDITINAGSVLVAGTGDPQSALIGSQSSFAGDSGNITIKAAGSIAVKDGGRITSTTFGAGNAGNITLTAGGPITLSGSDARIVGATFQPPDDQLNDLFNSVFFRTFDDFRAEMGNPSAKLMEVLAYLRSHGFDWTTFTPTDVAPFWVDIPNPPLTPGNAGAVSITTPALTLNAGTRIETSTGWESNAGSVVGNVGTLSVLDGGAIRSRSGVEFLDGSIGVGSGSAGSVMVSASDTITVSGQGSAISTSTFGDGSGGDVTLTAGNQVAVLNGGRVVGESGGLLGGTVAVGTGSGGSVSISAGNAINISGPGSTVSTTTFGDGAGGNVTLSANQVDVQSGGKAASESGGLLGGAVAVGTGAGGTVGIAAGSAITISGQDSVVSTSTFGDGKGGDVVLNAGNRVAILDGGRLKADSGGPLGGSIVSGLGEAGSVTITSGSEIYLNNGQITTQALTADGGNITLKAPFMVQLQDSVISTSVAGGLGQGGNILIDPQFVILNNSSIIANAFGGPGGNITIIADNFLASITSVIEASSALSTPGVIQIVSPDNNVESSIGQLPAAFLDASSQLRGLCSARRTGAPSSFVVAGRGGVPVDAGGYLPSFGSDVATGLAGARGPVRADAGPDGPRYALALAMADYRDCSR